MAEKPDPETPPPSPGMLIVRYGLGAAMIIGGIVMIILNPSGLGVDGFPMAVGGGLSVLMINFLFRLGASGDLERQHEEEARDYFDEHGVWPDEEKRQGRKWTLPAGAVTYEQEQRERRERRS